MKFSKNKIVLTVLIVIAGAIFFVGWKPNTGQATQQKKDVALVDEGLPLFFPERAEKTIGEFLTAENILLQEKDLILPAPEALLLSGTRIIITRAKPVSVAVNGGEQKIFSQG